MTKKKDSEVWDFKLEKDSGEDNPKTVDGKNIPGKRAVKKLKSLDNKKLKLDYNSLPSRTSRAKKYDRDEENIKGRSSKVQVEVSTKRIYAGLLDFTILVIIYFGVELNIGLLKNWMQEIGLDQLLTSNDVELKAIYLNIIFVISAHFFFYVLPVLITGQSIGKKLNGIVLEDKNGDYLSLEKVIFREYIVKPILLPYSVIKLMTAKDEKLLLLHDKICHSQVLRN